MSNKDILEQYIKELKLDYITPVEKHNSMYFKRDDLYQPFDDIPLSGGKVRQCLSLLAIKQQYIKDNCNNLVVTGTGVTSPQGIIVTRSAKYFDINSCIFVGNTKPESIRKNTLMMNILYQGGHINYESKQGYENCLNAVLKRTYPNAYHISFGLNAPEVPEAILWSTANQVQNIPDELDYLIVPCGSCIMLSGILLGIKKYNKQVKNVIGIQIAGYDRTKVIQGLINENLPYKLLLSKDYPYSKHLKSAVDGIVLDPLYEAKAYDYMTKYMLNDISNKKTLFWIVGNSTPVRNKIWKNM